MSAPRCSKGSGEMYFMAVPSYTASIEEIVCGIHLAGEVGGMVLLHTSQLMETLHLMQIEFRKHLYIEL